MTTFRTYKKIYTFGHEENADIFKNPEDDIVIQEKIDGANFRFMFNDGQIIFGSRTQMLSPDIEHKYAKNFERCIKHIREKVEGKDLSKYEGMIFFGECCVAHSMQYDWNKIPPYLGFDINNDSNQNYPKRFIPYPENMLIFKELELDFVPLMAIKKAKDISKIDDSIVPISEYAIESGTEDTRKAEGIVFKKYSFKEESEGDEGEEQIMAKYVRDKFKELNAEVFGEKRVKYNDDLDNGEFIFKYCTNTRIEKLVFKLIDEGEKLDMPLMSLLPKRVHKDIIEENWKEILGSNWILDMKKIRQMIPKRCAVVLKQIIVNNNLNNKK